MAEYEYLTNPPFSVIEEIDQEMFVTNGWSRVQKTMEISYEALDSFAVIVAVEPGTKKPVGIISVARDYGLEGEQTDPLLYIGSFYVSAEHRLKGVGKRLGTMAMAFGNGENTGMNGTLALVEQYKQAGFAHCREYKNAFATVETKDIRLKEDRGELEIKDIHEVEFKLVEKYDHSIGGRDRGKYLRLWLTKPPGGATRVSIDKTGEITGFVCINQQYTNRLVVGPFYADSTEIAEALLHSALSKFNLLDYSRVIFKFPETNEGVKSVLKSISSVPVAIVANGLAMFTQRALPTDPNRIYGFTETAHSFV